MGEPDKRLEPVPFLAIGNAAYGVIAIGNVACGVVAIGAGAACGVVAIGINTVGVVSIGLNAAGPISAALVNAIGVYTYALVNAFGGFGHSLVNAAVTPVLGLVLAGIGFVLATKLAARKPPPARVDDSLTPLARLPDAPAGSYDVLATVDRDGTQLVDGDARLRIELRDPAATLAGKRSRCSLVVEETFVEAEGDYRSAPERQRRYVVTGGFVQPRVWTRRELTHLLARAFQLSTLAAGGVCAVVLAT